MSGFWSAVAVSASYRHLEAANLADTALVGESLRFPAREVPVPLLDRFDGFPEDRLTDRTIDKMGQVALPGRRASCRALATHRALPRPAEGAGRGVRPEVRLEAVELARPGGDGAGSGPLIALFRARAGLQPRS